MLFNFHNPQYLFLLLAVPLIFIIHFFTLNNRKKKALKFANFDAISRIEGIDFFSKNWVVLFLSSLIIACLVLSISGLIIYIKPFQGASLYSFSIAIDSSKSMEAKDLTPTRLSAAKEAAVNFAKEMPVGTRVSVVSFSAFTYVEQELTTNENDIVNSIKNIRPSDLGGTDLYEAVVTSSNLLRGERNKAIILLSDGQINTGNIKGIIEYSNKNSIPIYTIAIGTEEGGKTSYGISKVNKEFLENIADETGGKFYEVKSNTDLSLTFTEVLRLTKEKAALDMSTYLIILAIVLFFIMFFLINTRYFDFI